MSPRELLKRPVDGRVLVGVLVPFMVWLIAHAWDSKLDRLDFERHLVDHAVQAEKIDEILCTIKPHSKHCQ